MQRAQGEVIPQPPLPFNTPLHSINLVNVLFLRLHRNVYTLYSGTVKQDIYYRELFLTDNSLKSGNKEWNGLGASTNDTRHAIVVFRISMFIGSTPQAKRKKKVWKKLCN